MQNVLTFYLEMKEMMSSELMKMGKNAKKVFASTKAGAAKVIAKNNVLAKSYDFIKRKINQVGTSLDKIRKKAMTPIPKGGGMLGSMLPMLGVAGAMTLGGNILQKGMDSQARLASFEVLAGKEKGQNLKGNLDTYAQDSIYGTEVNKTAQTMLGFGIEVGNVMPNLKMLGDVAMGDANKLQSLTLAFSQVRAGGKLTGQDLLQFINAGFNPLNEMAKTTGLSLGELKNKMSQGAISAQMVKDAFVSATSEGGDFYKMTDTIAKTDFGKWEAFKGQISGLAQKLGGELAPVFGSFITNALKPFITLVSNFIELVKEYRYVFGAMAVAVAGYAVVVGIAGIASTEFTIAQWAMNIALSANPIGLVVAGLAALAVGLVYAYNHSEKFRGVLLGVWEVMKLLGKNMKEIYTEYIQPVFTGIGKAIDKLKTMFSGFGSSVAETFKSAFSPLIDGVKWIMGTKVGKKISSWFGSGTSEYIDAFNRGQEMAKSTKPLSLNSVTGGVSISAPSNAKSKAIQQVNQEALQNTVSGVAASGPRTININGVKFADKIEIVTGNIEEGLDELEEKMETLFLRVLNSAAAVG